MALKWKVCQVPCFSWCEIILLTVQKSQGQPPCLEWCKNSKIMLDKLPTPTGFHGGVPAINNMTPSDPIKPSRNDMFFITWLIEIPRCLLVEPCDRKVAWRGVFPMGHTRGCCCGDLLLLLWWWFVVICCGGQSLAKKFLCHFHKKHFST